MDVLTLEETAAAWLNYSGELCPADKEVALFELFSGNMPVTPEDAMRMCGCSLALVSTLRAMGFSRDGEEAEEMQEEGDWMEEFDHEDAG